MKFWYTLDEILYEDISKPIEKSSQSLDEDYDLLNFRSKVNKTVLKSNVHNIKDDDNLTVAPDKGKKTILIISIELEKHQPWKNFTKNLTTIYELDSLEKKNVKYLGVFFDENMQWDYQIKNITQKVNFKLGNIKTITPFFMEHTKNLLSSNQEFILIRPNKPLIH